MRSIKPAVILLLIAPAIVFTSALLWAMETGSIRGAVTEDKTGVPITGATVQVVGTSAVAVTDSDGFFVIRGVLPGVRTIRVEMPSFTTLEITDVTIEANETTGLFVTLTKAGPDPNRVKTISGAETRRVDFVEDSVRWLTEDKVIGLPQATEAEESGRASRLKEALDLSPLVGAASDNAIVRKPKSSPMPPRPGRGRRHDRRDRPWGHYPPAHGGTAVVNGQPFDAMFFEHYGTNPFVDSEDDHLSTFAIDVDDASYIMTRSYLESGYLPPKDAVRVEEFINHFDYEYAPPTEAAFRIDMEGAPSHFGRNCQLLRIGIKGQEIREENRQPANLVFVIDVSGSMGREDRLGLVKKALRLLVDELNSNDRVGIVIYGSSGREVLQPTGIRNKRTILNAIERLHPGGSTNAEEGLALGYRMADRCFTEGHINRIILCSDGVANVGVTGPDAILKQIKRYANMGITLTTVGFGMGNYNDVLMEKLGNKGNGSYAYVDDLAEARRVFVQNLTGLLQVIARDVKIQVDFNPDVVRSYRLLGYENRDVADNQFRDDTVDGGEIGSGHEVTALYEIKLHRSSSRGPLGNVFVRFKDPQTNQVTEVKRNISRRLLAGSFERASLKLKLAAASAEFAEILRHSYWARRGSLDDVLAMVKEISRESDSHQVIELMDLIAKSKRYQDAQNELAGK